MGNYNYLDRQTIIDVVDSVDWSEFLSRKKNAIQRGINNFFRRVFWPGGILLLGYAGIFISISITKMVNI